MNHPYTDLLRRDRESELIIRFYSETDRNKLDEAVFEPLVRRYRTVKGIVGAIRNQDPLEYLERKNKVDWRADYFLNHCMISEMLKVYEFSSHHDAYALLRDKANKTLVSRVRMLSQSTRIGPLHLIRLAFDEVSKSVPSCDAIGLIQAADKVMRLDDQVNRLYMQAARRNGSPTDFIEARVPSQLAFNKLLSGIRSYRFKEHEKRYTSRF
jgi:hypothetical protein